MEKDLTIPLLGRWERAMGDASDAVKFKGFKGR